MSNSATGLEDRGMLAAWYYDQRFALPSSNAAKIQGQRANMGSLTQRTLVCALAVCASCAAPAVAQTGAKPAATIRQVAVLSGGNGVEVEIAASQPVTPQTLVVTGPDRLVIDFLNAVPGTNLHNISIVRGELRGVRVGLYSIDPPVTRVVLDLKSPQTFQLVPSGKTVIVKLNAGANQALSQPATVSNAAPTPVAAPARRVDVEFHNGRLSIWADKATLAEVLNEVHRRTGADIPIPAGADQEQVVANYGPAPARDVLAALLNGSRFNFIMVGSARDPYQLRSVLLTPRGEGASQPMNSYSPPAVAETVSEPTPPPPQADNPPERQGDEPQPQ
jgi:hypothetical protein